MAEELQNGGSAVGDPESLEGNAEQTLPKQVRVVCY